MSHPKDEAPSPDALKAKAEDLLGAGRLIVLQRLPYLYAKLLLLAWRVVVGLGTVAVTKRMVALYDPAAVAGWNPRQCAGAQVHELMHTAMAHFARMGARDPMLWNFAGDLCINPGILAAGLELPEGVLLPDKLGLPPDLVAEEYYDLLLKQQEEAQKEGGSSSNEGEKSEGGDQDGAGQGEGEGHAGHGHGAGKPKLGGGWCGSCAGRAVPNEPADGDPTANERSEAEVGRIAREIAEAVKEQASKGKGSVPAGWARWADSALEPPRIPWQTELSRAVRQAIDRRPGAVNLTSQRMGRRQAGVGYGVGKPVLPALYSPVPVVAILQDSSGSMGTEELTAGVRESRGILKAIGAEVVFLSCDAAVHSCKRVSTWQELAAEIKGGGGSDFHPAFEEIVKMRPRPSVVVAITDGMIDVPERQPEGCNVIWLVVGAGHNPPCAWGKAIRLED